VLLRLADPDERYAAVRLHSDLDALEYERAGEEWTLDLGGGAGGVPVQRLEYELELVHADGASERVCDPGNPLRAPGAFGEKSVLLLEGYEPPAWLDAPQAEGAERELTAPGRGLGMDVAVRIWSPADAKDRDRLPLLVANDGPEYAELAGLTGYCAAMIAGDALPPHRVALLAPGLRDEWYSASPLYAGALVRGVLPAIAAEVGVRGTPVAIGASLGALAMLHAQHRHPGAFSGLFLQSGSFFVPALDSQERGFSRFARVTAFVAEVLTGGRGSGAAPAVLTCGAAEENIHNNRTMAAALGDPLHELEDMHNYTAWRDALDPHLTGLLQELWW
jgi:enterochelin esterase family protein